MPGPYDATLLNNYIYWTMHVTTFGAALLLWHALLARGAKNSGAALAVTFGTGIQMKLLGAVLSLAPRPMFVVHLTTTWPWVHAHWLFGSCEGFCAGGPDLLPGNPGTLL